MKKRSLALLLAVCMAFAAVITPATAAFEFKDFPDVSSDAWYYDCVGWLSALEIVNGDTDGYFYPDRPIKRSEFLKMISIATELVASPTPLRGVHWAEPSWLMCVENGLLDYNGENIIPLDFDALEQYITRYEMAVIISNAMESVMMENTVEISSPEVAITDYSSVPEGYRSYVEQAYGKGVITGFTDGSFGGDETLTRAQASMAVYRLLWNNERVEPEFDYTVIEKEEPVAPEIVPDGTPFAVYVQENGLLNAYGRPSSALCEMLFGSEYKNYFTSAADAGDYIVDVEVPVWRINSAGQKYSTTAWLQVHKLVANDVVGIFTAIFNDPEQFPIQSVGGARYSDTLRHSWGCAIDINPTQNAYGYYSNGSLVCSVGEGWWPGSNEYSITADGSVVRAFEAYGWGWGGQGYSSGWYDYMHFSIMPSGG